MDKEYRLFQIAIVLFFIGLIIFTASITWMGYLLHPVIGSTVLSLFVMFYAGIIIGVIVSD